MFGKVGKADNEPSDDFVVERLKLGDKDALAVLFDRYADMIYRIGFKIFRAKVEAQDLVQEVFLQLFCGSIQSYDPKKANSEKGNFRAWLMRFAFCRAYDRRKHLISRKYDDSVPVESVEIEEPESLTNVVFLNEQGHRLRKAFLELNDIQKKTLHLYFFEDMDLYEISEVLPDTYANTRNHYYRGLNKLRESLKKVEVTK